MTGFPLQPASFSMTRALSLFRLTLSLALLVCLALFVVRTLHWPLVGDASLLHYVNFLMDHGMVLYRDIVDMNMPGSYLIERAGIRVYGASAFGWRLFDFTLLTTIAAAMIAIGVSRSRDWFPGLFAAAFFALIHGRDGIDQTAERDLIMSVALLVACAFLIYAVRRRSILLTSLFGVFAGVATTIKPTAALLWLVLLVMAATALRRQHERPLPYLTAGTLGFVASLGMAAAFLVHEHALAAFLAISRNLMPRYAIIGRLPFGYLLGHSFPSYLLPLVLLWIAALVLRARIQPLAEARTSLERRMLLAGIAFGLISYLAQGKGFPYHRYPLLAFLLLLLAMDLTAALRHPGVQRLVGMVGLIFGACFLAPICLAKLSHYDGRTTEFVDALTTDLNARGGTALTRQVQCMDTGAGCITTLNRMQLVQATGFFWDCYLLQPGEDPTLAHWRKQFLDQILEHPPAVFVISDQYCFTSAPSYTKLSHWPAFAQELATGYTLSLERKWPAEPPHLVRWWSQPRDPYGYRIYLRKIIPDGDASRKSARP